MSRPCAIQSEIGCSGLPLTRCARAFRNQTSADRGWYAGFRSWNLEVRCLPVPAKNRTRRCFVRAVRDFWTSESDDSLLDVPAKQNLRFGFTVFFSELRIVSVPKLPRRSGAHAMTWMLCLLQKDRSASSCISGLCSIWLIIGAILQWSNRN